MNIFLIIVLLILVFCTINGWRKGLLGIVYGFISWIFILIFVIWANPHIEDYLIHRTGVYDKVVETTQTFIMEKIPESNLQLDTSLDSQDTADGDTTDSSEEAQSTDIKDASGQDILEQLGIELPDAIAKACNEAISNAEGTAIEAATTTLSDFIIKGIAVLIAMIIAGIITRLVGYIIHLVGDLPVISGINGFFGLAAGAIQGFLLVWIIMYVIAWISTSETGQILIGYIGDSRFLTYLYQHNLIITILQNF